MYKIKWQPEEQAVKQVVFGSYVTVKFFQVSLIHIYSKIGQRVMVRAASIVLSHGYGALLTFDHKPYWLL